MNDRLARLASAAGIDFEYWDALGTRRELGEPTARAILHALGFDPDGDVDAQLAAVEGNLQNAPQPAPQRCYVPEALQNGRRVWGLAVQLYSLRSARNWGIGDFTDLGVLAAIAARHGAAVIGLNPLHARHLACPDEASPYSPSSRSLLDPMAIDVEAVPDFAHSDECRALVASPLFRARIDAARATRLVDHPAVCALKLEALECLFASFDRSKGSDSIDPARSIESDPFDRRRDFEAFVAAHGATLIRFAEFEALRLERAAQSLPVRNWHEWPDEWRDPDSAAMRRFRVEHARDIRFQLFLQWEAARQLHAAAAVASAAGLELVFYRDLAVGAAKDSAEAWGDQALTLHTISIGAPPDQFSVTGQNWGLPPMNPRVLAERRYRPFASLIAANMAGAGALRIDHVMALTRLFWIPDGMAGADGAYVSQPFDALAAIVADESVRHRCMVIGEDLGSVPDGLRERLQALGFLSYRVLLFERHWNDGGRFKPPHEYPQQALATAVTHDMPTIADFWTFGDIARRAKLGLFADQHAQEQETARRHEERWKLLALMNEAGLAPADPEDTTQITDALHALVARTPSMLAIVQLDDVLGETEPANIPGTDREYPNWRRKLSRTLEEIATDPRMDRLGAVMKDAGRG